MVSMSLNEPHVWYSCPHVVLFHTELGLACVTVEYSGGHSGDSPGEVIEGITASALISWIVFSAVGRTLVVLWRLHMKKNQLGHYTLLAMGVSLLGCGSCGLGPSLR